MRALTICSAMILSLAVAAQAEEGGSGHYAPGAAATLIDLPPTEPGFIVQGVGLHYQGDVSSSVDVPVAGRITAGLDASVNSASLGALYTFDQRILGAFYTVGALVPFVDVEVTASLASPLGQIRRTDRESGLGDVVLIPGLLAWKTGEWQVSASLPVYAPTGSFDKGRLANTGKNYWSVDPTLSVAYSDPSNGFNAAVFAGVTINSQNTSTDYRSGSLLHVEGSVQQLFPVGPGLLGIGVNAFWLEQITDDTGPGATLGEFRGRSIGIGPVIDYVLPMENATALVELRWLPELETRNRVEGDYFWLKGVIQF